jgi:hypothetical protein
MAIIMPCQQFLNLMPCYNGKIIILAFICKPQAKPGKTRAMHTLRDTELVLIPYAEHGNNVDEVPDEKKRIAYLMVTPFCFS